MNCTLIRKQARADGIFGSLFDDQNNEIAVALEHAFGEGPYMPKVAAGIYTCQRHAPNRFPFVTFELQNVPDFDGKPVAGILIHPGNYNKDSDGCILLGRSVAYTNDGTGEQMIAMSQTTFNYFMRMQANADNFTLTIKEEYP